MRSGGNCPDAAQRSERDAPLIRDPLPNGVPGPHRITRDCAAPGTQYNPHDHSPPKSATRLDIVVADITTLDVDAIVNAANRSLLGGGGVDGAIHRAAGPELLAECETLGGCDTGSAKITPRLSAEGAPRHPRGRAGVAAAAATTKRRCWRAATAAALDLAAAHTLASIAYPAISTGIYRFPARSRRAHRGRHRGLRNRRRSRAASQRVVFCCFSAESAEHHKEAFAELGLV